MDSIEFPFDLWINIYRYFGVQKEVDDTWSESNTSSSVLPSNLLASTLSDEFVQVEEMEKSSTHSIRIGESLLAVIPSHVSLEVYENYNVSYSNTYVASKYIWTTIVEYELSFQLFSNDSSILSFEKSFPMIAQEDEEESNSSLSNVVVGV